jgi:hypothetical protein
MVSVAGGAGEILVAFSRVLCLYQVGVTDIASMQTNEVAFEDFFGMAMILQLAASSPGACQHRARSGEKARTSKRSGPPE